MLSGLRSVNAVTFLPKVLIDFPSLTTWPTHIASRLGGSQEYINMKEGGTINNAFDPGNLEIYSLAR